MSERISDKFFEESKIMEIIQPTYICGICNNEFTMQKKYPEIKKPPYVQLWFMGHYIARPLCPHCFDEWKEKLKIKDADFWKKKQ